MKTKGYAYWCKLGEPENAFGNPQWNLLLKMEKSEAQKLKAAGLSTDLEKDENDDPTGFYTYRFRRYLKKRGKGGKNNPKPEVYDPALNKFDGIIGNGSLVYVIHQPYPWDNNFGKGVSSDLRGVQILNLIEYTPAEKSANTAEEESLLDGEDSFKIEGPALSDIADEARDTGLFDEPEDDEEPF